jgi:hypothetical protein
LAAPLRFAEADDRFAHAPFGERAERPKLFGARPQDRKDNNMIAVALVVGGFAVVGLVLIARADYRQRRPIR